MYFCYSMKVAQKIENDIDKFAEGTTFRYRQLSIEPDEYVAAAKAMERFIQKGIIKRVSTGIFYKPKSSVFGELIPNEEELLKPYLFQNNKRTAYLTGISLYNKMGLTTQIPKTINIASRDKRISVSLGAIKATPVKSYVDVTDTNFYLLQILDALKDFKKISDLNIKLGIKILLNRIKRINTKEIKLLIDCALSYPPRVRAMLGALLEKTHSDFGLELLKSSLNPLSEYRFRIDKNVLSTAPNWNIK